MKECCLKTVLATLPTLWFQYHASVLNDEGPSMCFQIIGVDVLIDHSMRIYLLETNNGPSLNLDEESDRAVKLGVVTSALEMVKTHYRQPPSRPPDKSAPVSEEEVLDLRQVLPTHLSRAPCHVPPVTCPLSRAPYFRAAARRYSRATSPRPVPRPRQRHSPRTRPPPPRPPSSY